MILLLVPPILAGLLGLVAVGAQDAAAYLPRLRFMMIGAVVVGYLGVAAHVYRKEQGLVRWGSIVVALLVTRILYPALLYLAVLVTAWLSAGGRWAGSHNLEGPVHFTLAVLLSFGAVLAGLMGLAIVTRIKRWFIAAILVGLVGVVSVWDAEDRHVSPHRFRSRTSPAVYGPDYMEAAKDKDRKWDKRLEALFSAIFHGIMPHVGWGGEIRSELLARFKGDPDMGVQDRVTALEAALVKARPALRTSARTPPASSGRRRLARS